MEKNENQDYRWKGLCRKYLVFWILCFCKTLKILILYNPRIQNTLLSFSFVSCHCISSSSSISKLYPYLTYSMIDHVKMDHNWLMCLICTSNSWVVLDSLQRLFIPIISQQHYKAGGKAVATPILWDLENLSCLFSVKPFKMSKC